MAPFKTCACGITYTRAQWLARPSIGRRMLAGELLDYRNCVCRSTMAVRVPTHYVPAGGGSLRPAVCGALCRAGGPWEDGDGRVEAGVEFGTTRILSTRCRACVLVLRAMRAGVVPANVYVMPADAKIGLYRKTLAKLGQSR